MSEGAERVVLYYNFISVFFFQLSPPVQLQCLSTLLSLSLSAVCFGEQGARRCRSNLCCSRGALLQSDVSEVYSIFESVLTYTQRACARGLADSLLAVTLRSDVPGAPLSLSLLPLNAPND